MDKAEAISRAAAAENCCAREKAKKGRKISIGFCFFSFAFCFCPFWGLRKGGSGGAEPAGRRTVGISLLCLLCGCHRAQGRGREEKGSAVRAYCVEVWREFSINEKRTAQRGKSHGAAVLVQHATHSHGKLHTGLCVCQMVPRGMCKRWREGEGGSKGAWVTFQLRFQLPTMRAGRAEEAHTQLGG